MKRWFVILLVFFVLGATVEADETAVVEHFSLPHWKLTRVGVNFDISEDSIRVENGRNEKIFVELKRIELDGKETPLVGFEVGAANSSVTVGSFGGSVQSQALLNQKLGLGNEIKIVILSYVEHVTAKTDTLVARFASKLKGKEVKAPAAKNIHTETIKLM